MTRRRKMLCMGHRGTAGHAPENTLLAIRKGLELGADGVEVDVYLVEGRLIVIHDDTLDRTTSGTGPVAGASLEHIRSLDAGQGERVPFLEEVFDALGRKAFINIELKGPDTALPAVALIRQYVKEPGWTYARFIVSSFDYDLLRTVRRVNPRIRLGFLFRPPTPPSAEFFAVEGAHAIHPRIDAVTPELVEDAHFRGLKVFPYNVDDPADIQRMRELEADGVFTDWPERCG